MGNHFLVSKEDPDNSFLDNHFRDIQRALSESEKKCLSGLAKNDQNSGNLSVRKRLENIGLIRKQGADYTINIPFYKDYLISNEKTQGETPIPEASKIADRAEVLIYDINKNRQNLGKKPVFEPIIETQGYLKNIRTPCISRDDFGKFSSSLYRLLCETTKDIDHLDPKRREKNKQRLPESFCNKNQRFLEIVEMLRHSFGEAHTMSNFPKNKYPRILEDLTGSKFEPQSAEDFIKMQVEVLKRYENALQDLFRIIKDEQATIREITDYRR